jgi:hypothetical protein
MAQGAHAWRFHRVGGLDQVSLETAEDLRSLPKLDQKLWTALACPTQGLEIDQKTLELLDADADGRVRAPELLAAVSWCDARLRDLAALVAGHAELPLEGISTETPEGRALLGAAQRVLESRGKAGAAVIGPEDVADLTHVFDGTDFNGDGVVPPEAAGEDGAARQLLLDAIACEGSTPDRSGRPGVDRKRLSLFFAELAAHDAWWKEGETPATRPLGDATDAAWAAVAAVRAKTRDFFARCRLAAVDPRGGLLLGRSEAEVTALAATDLSRPSPELEALPLARVAPGSALPLAGSVNPAWSGALAALARDAVTPVLGPGREALGEADWAAVEAAVAPYEAWQAAKRGAAMKIAASFTQGDSDFLTVGRNGVFYDRQGRDWDATIVKIIDNPISIRQAFFAPYKKFLRLVEEQVAKFAAAKEQESAARLSAAASGTVAQATGTARPVARAEAVDIGKMVGIIAAIGVGAGALGTLFGGLVSGFLGLQPWWAKLVAVAGVVLVISGPSVVIAWLKLRQRTLGPVLDANGWAVNGRVKVNLPLGYALTARALLPPGSTRSLKDPYEDRAAARRRLLLWTAAVLVAAALAAARWFHVWPFGVRGQ